MESLSDKAKIVYATFLKLGAIGEENKITSLKMLGAEGSENKVTSYAILDFISENEDLQEHELLKDVNETDFVDIIMELNIKSVNTIIASLCRKGLVEKTEPTSMTIDGQRRNLRQYFIK